MAQLIKFKEGITVEVAENPNRVQAVSGKAADKVASGFESATEVLSSIIKTVSRSIKKELEAAGVAEAELEFGVGFSIEGNIYITKTTGEGNLSVRMKVNGNKN